MQKPWREFKRTYQEEFWGAVDAEGNWVDSAATFEQAKIWCAYDHHNGACEGDRDVTNAVRQGKYSVIHSELLERMYNAGLIK